MIVEFQFGKISYFKELCVCVKFVGGAGAGEGGGGGGAW